MMSYSVITNTSREVRARWTGTRIELAVFGANMMTDVQVEWHSSVEAAAERFQWLIEHNSKPVKKIDIGEFVCKSDHYDYNRGYCDDDMELWLRIADTY